MKNMPKVKQEQAISNQEVLDAIHHLSDDLHSATPYTMERGVALEKDVKILKDDVTILKYDVSTLKNNLSTLESKVDHNHDEVMTKLDNITVLLNENRTERASQIDWLKRHDNDITMIKQHVGLPITS